MLNEFNVVLSSSLLEAVWDYQKGNVENFKSAIQSILHEPNSSGEYLQNVNHLHNKLCGLLCLAFHSITQGDAEKDARKSAFFYDEAAGYLNECDSIDAEHPLLWISKGILIISRNRILREKHAYESARSHFLFVLERYPELSSALLGKAITDYSLGEYKEAIKTLKHTLVVEGSQNASPSIRTALGLCFFNLGDFESARQCFQRRLALLNHPQCPISLLALALIEKKLNTSTLDKYLSYLKSAYSCSKSNPLVLNALSEHFFTKKEFQKAEALALNALNCGYSEKGKAQSCYILGKIYHTQSNVDDAYAYYMQTTRFDPDFVAARYGLAQLYIQKEDHSTAIMELERALELSPNDPIILKLLSFLYATTPKDKKKAIKIMKTILSSEYTDDIETMLELASLIEQVDPEDAENLYKRSYGILKESNIPIPIELLNNLGVLTMDKDLEGSLQLLHEARQISDDKKRCVIDYSIARSMELAGSFDKAIEIYKSLIASNSPKALLSHIRLGLISMNHLQDDKAASDHFKDAIGLNESAKEAWIGLALLHLKEKAITPARKTFERILSKIDKHDIFSLLSLGNIHLQIAKHEQKTLQHTWEASLGRAIEFFQKCLMLNGNNFYAVNGMAIAIAMKGPQFLHGARDAFLAIRQEEPGFIDAWINLAHTYVEDQHYAAAQGIYEHCWKKLIAEKKRNKEKITSELALYIAKSFYLTGKVVKDITAFSKAVEWIERVLPTTEDEKLMLQFNEAISRQEYAACALQNDTISAQSFEDIKSALHNLDKAVLLFESLCIVANEKAPTFIDVKIARQRIKYCHSLKQSAQRHYEEYLEKEEEKKKNKEKYARFSAEAALKQEEEARLRKEAAEKEQREIEEMRRATREKLAEVQAKWRSEIEDSQQTPKQKKSKRHKGRKEDDLSWEGESVRADYNENISDAVGDVDINMNLGEGQPIASQDVLNLDAHDNMELDASSSPSDD